MPNVKENPVDRFIKKLAGAKNRDEAIKVLSEIAIAQAKTIEKLKDKTNWLYSALREIAGVGKPATAAAVEAAVPANVDTSDPEVAWIMEGLTGEPAAAAPPAAAPVAVEGAPTPTTQAAPTAQPPPPPKPKAKSNGANGASRPVSPEQSSSPQPSPSAK